jgi:thiamine pyrophosphokinase
MIINLLAGGPVDYIPNLEEYDSYGKEEIVWAGIDRGVYHLLQFGIKPKVAFGDFDSVTEEEFQEIVCEVNELKRFHPEKDETDMELALNWAISQRPRKIHIFGGTGGRLDHFMANVSLLLKPLQVNEDCMVEIIDRNNIIFLKKPGIHSIERDAEKKYISFLPVSPEITGLTLKGFKYPLNNCHISIGSTLCISNELIINHGTFSFNQGILMVIRSQD